MFAQVAGAVVDGFVRTDLLAQLAFFIARRCRDHASTRRFGDLDGCRPHAARSAQYEHRLAGLQLCAVEQRMVGRAVGEHERSGVVERKTFREWHHGGGVCNRVGGKAASSTESCHGVA